MGTLATRRVRAAAPREILLARLHVAGTAYYDAEAAADRLRPGQRLALRRQPENRYDALAIEVLGPEGHNSLWQKSINRSRPEVDGVA